jgi:hypothetical protein
MDPSSRDETCTQPSGVAPGGRPRRWRTAAEKHRAHRQRQAQRQRLTGELLLAVRNARVECPQLHQAAQQGDDTALLQELVRYYRQRHWQHSQKEVSR